MDGSVSRSHMNILTLQGAQLMICNNLGNTPTSYLVPLLGQNFSLLLVCDQIPTELSSSHQLNIVFSANLCMFLHTANQDSSSYKKSP